MTPFIEFATRYMPMLCAVFLLALLANLYCLIAAIVYRTPPRTSVHCSVVFGVNFFSMAILTEGCCALYDGKMPSRISEFCMHVPWPTAVLLGVTLVIAGILTCVRLTRWQNRHISRMSIKESVDILPTGLAFGYGDGIPRLINLRMNALSHALTGEAVSDMNVFWKTITDGTLVPGNERACDGESPIIQMKDGTVWTFEQKRLSRDGAVVIQLTAVDTTEEYHLAQRLEEENRRLREMNRRLCDYGETVREVTREKELLEAKARIHDELGHALIASRRLLATKGLPEELKETVALWKRSVSILNKANAREPMENGYARLTNAAKAIGVNIVWCGETPEEGTDVARVLLSAAHECLTNAVRHAGATELSVQTKVDNEYWSFYLTNDGDKPASAIREGGGLSSLRSLVKDAGGKMMISHAPRFELSIKIPEKFEVEIG